MKSHTLFLLAVIASGATLKAQADPEIVPPILTRQLQSPQLVTFQLQQFLHTKVPALVIPGSAEKWTDQAQRVRRHLLDDVVFHGWPQEWVSSPPHFESLGSVPAGKGYSLRKLRFEIVPGFYSTALLYEPENVQGRVPAVLNVMGHFVEAGNKEEFEQKMCINQALKGMIALNLEWIGMGELNTRFNEHWFASQLDLVGMNGVGLFYLAMRRGLDYLAANPHVDPDRMGVTGLSGGGWQTITLSSLDPRVLVSIPVAGYVNLQGRLERLPEEPGDLEQNPTDFLVGQDYSTLTAMRAPRPTLLIYNAEDDCCFRAPLVRPYVFDPVVPFFKLYGKADAFQFYQSTLISAHNYALEDQAQAFAFFIKHFHLTADSTEIPVGQYVKTFDELKGGIPDDNLTILGLARKMASGLKRPPVPLGQAESTAWSDSQRANLRSVVRYHPVAVSNIMRVANTHHNQVESISYRFEMSNGLSSVGTWLREVQIGDPAPLTIVINDKGKKGAATEIWDRAPEIAHCMERGEQVLAVDLVGMGDAAPDQPFDLISEMLAATGERPLGMETAQLISLAHWAQAEWAPSQMRLEGTGIRSQVISLVASALEPKLFSRVELRGGMHSLSYLLEEPVEFKDAPDLFCLDLYKEFDLDRLAALAKPAEVIQHGFVELSAPGK
jgi:dienelactone hydrolase